MTRRMHIEIGLIDGTKHSVVTDAKTAKTICDGISARWMIWKPWCWLESANGRVSFKRKHVVFVRSS